MLRVYVKKREEMGREKGREYAMGLRKREEIDLIFKAEKRGIQGRGSD